VTPAASPLRAERTDRAPDEQDDADAGKDGPGVGGDPDDEEDRSNDGAGERTVVASEEKEHERFLSD
jgi:hypothetical protein